MKLASWNVNGIRAVERKGLLSYIADTTYDVYCLQETKADPEQLSQQLIAPDGYQSLWASSQIKRGYSGVAVYTRHKPLSVSNMNIDQFDQEGRYIQLEYRDFYLINTYFPNSQDKGKRLDYKLAFCQALFEKLQKLRLKKDIILCGDYNIAHKEIDLARPKQNQETAGFLPEERAWMTHFLSHKYVDTFRHFSNEPHNYSWWSYRSNAREKNIGWRIDYFCVNEEAISKVSKSEIHPEVQGSDHCPVVLEIDMRT